MSACACGLGRSKEFFGCHLRSVSLLVLGAERARVARRVRMDLMPQFLWHVLMRHAQCEVRCEGEV